MKNFELELTSYEAQEHLWPETGNHILSHYDESSIVVYQAYNSKIAKQLVEAQNFHSDSVLQSGFNLNRMTWIKTNFLWMMFRSAWATKSNQEKILAIRITRAGFEDILTKAVLSKNSSNKNNEVILQWDPDHMPNGDKVQSGRRAIQLGLRGNMVNSLFYFFKSIYYLLIN
jgi:hypothetical protein